MSAASWKLLRLRLNAALEHFGYDTQRVVLSYNTVAGDMSESPESWTAWVKLPYDPERWKTMYAPGRFFAAMSADGSEGPKLAHVGASGEDAFCNLVMSIVRAAEAHGWHCTI